MLLRDDLVVDDDTDDGDQSLEFNMLLFLFCMERDDEEKEDFIE